MVTAVTCDEAAEVYVVDYDSIKEADAEWLDNYAGSYSDADGVGYDAVDGALGRASEAVEDWTNRGCHGVVVRSRSRGGSAAPEHCFDHGR